MPEKKFGFWLVFLGATTLLLLAGCASSPTGGKTNTATKNNASTISPNVKSLAPSAFSEMLENEDFFLLDVHIPEQKHIGGTDAFIPFDEIDSNIGKLPKDKNAKIVVYCRSGNMSKIASEKLAELGYSNVYDLEGGIVAYDTYLKSTGRNKGNGENASAKSADSSEITAPSKCKTLNAKWGNLLPKLVDAGVIDKQNFVSLHTRSGTMGAYELGILENGSNEAIVINRTNAHFILNSFWALGLGNRNTILNSLANSGYDAGYFASTGGWTLGKYPGGKLIGIADVIKLDEKQQALVESVTKNVYRPCCNNPTNFPDCNHGMAALGLAELMAFQGANESEIYDALLVANSYWFMQNYLDIATYYQEQGVAWENVSAKEALGAERSSYTGYSNTLAQLKNRSLLISGVSCGV